MQLNIRKISTKKVRLFFPKIWQTWSFGKRLMRSQFIFFSSNTAFFSFCSQHASTSGSRRLPRLFCDRLPRWCDEGLSRLRPPHHHPHWRRRAAGQGHLQVRQAGTRSLPAKAHGEGQPRLRKGKGWIVGKLGFTNKSFATIGTGSNCAPCES